jgi:5-methyltetrahydropteroyltriglutamate--homocysteine methyltransferase
VTNLSLRRDTPPFRADHVGSLLRPPKLLVARDDFRHSRISQKALTKIEEGAVRDVVKMQEDIGLRSITDGEYRRGIWHVDFLGKIENVTRTRSPVKVHFHTDQGPIERNPTAFRVEGKLSRPAPIFVNHFKFLKSVTKQTAKLTIPSPTLLHFRGGRDAVDKTAYPDMAEFYADLGKIYAAEVKDLGAAGCKYLQLDEVNFAYLCDPSLREEVKRMGEDPDTLPHTYAKLINSAIKTRPKDMAITMHLCRGNFEGAWLAEGGYEPVAETLFNEIEADGYFLEYDTPRAGDFKPLRFLPKGKIAVLGLVSSKQAKLESKDDIKRRIEEAARYVPFDQIALSPQCGFASSEKGNKLTVEDEIAKLKLVVDVAREMWGKP